MRVLLLQETDHDAELITNELASSGMTITAQRVSSADAFSSALQSFAPDVVISDHSLEHFDSFAALEILRSVRPTVPFIIVSGALTGAQSVAAVRAGAEDIIHKPYLGRLPSAMKDGLVVRRPLQKLTERQVEVLRLVTEGYRTRAIAQRLGLSVKTIESHRGEIMKRLRVHDVASLVRYAVRVGLVSASGPPP
jgi:DNA-binding NarL/FixJ family response regulator